MLNMYVFTGRIEILLDQQQIRITTPVQSFILHMWVINHTIVRMNYFLPFREC